MFVNTTTADMSDPLIFINIDDTPSLGNKEVMTSSYEIRWWAQCLGLSGEEILDAVHTVGNLVADVREYLQR